MYVECVVVAEQSSARLFIRDRQRKRFNEIEDLVNPQSRLRDQELKSDRPGHGRYNRGNNRHGMEEKSEPTKQSAIRFAKDICALLEANRSQYERLILVAPPEFLGLLRENLPNTLAKLVDREIDKELVRKNPQEIEDYLRQLPE